MNVTRIHVAGRSGHNGAPSSGDVWFSDGKSYGFIRNWNPERREYDGFVFFTVRQRVAHTERVSFRSPRRSTALATYLNQ